MTSTKEKLYRYLGQLGLSDKAGAVYLAALEHGPHPVQNLAKFAGVNRATAYSVIDELLEEGLMTSVERGARKYFAAEPPERLMDMVGKRAEEAEEMRKICAKILPELSVVVSRVPDRPHVRFYEGFEGLEAMRAEFFRNSGKKEFCVITSADDYYKIVGLARRLPHAKRIEKLRGLEQCIFTSSKPAAELKKSLSRVLNIERYRVPEEQFPLSGEVAVLGDKVALLTYRGNVMGVLVESQFIAETMRSLFRMAWETAKKFEPFHS